MLIFTNRLNLKRIVNMRTKSVISSALLAGVATVAPAKGSTSSSSTGSSPTSYSTVTGTATSGASATTTGFVATNEGGFVPGYSNANAPFADYSPTPLSNVVTSFGPDSQISAIHTTAPSAGKSGAADTLRSNLVTGPTSHGPYSGTPTTTGAVSNSPQNATIATLPLNPTLSLFPIPQLAVLEPMVLSQGTW